MLHEGVWEFSYKNNEKVCLWLYVETNPDCLLSKLYMNFLSTFFKQISLLLQTETDNLVYWNVHDELYMIGDHIHVKSLVCHNDPCRDHYFTHYTVQIRVIIITLFKFGWGLLLHRRWSSTKSWKSLGDRAFAYASLRHWNKLPL